MGAAERLFWKVLGIAIHLQAALTKYENIGVIGNIIYPVPGYCISPLRVFDRYARDVLPV